MHSLSGLGESSFGCGFHGARVLESEGRKLPRRQLWRMGQGLAAELPREGPAYVLNLKGLACATENSSHGHERASSSVSRKPKGCHVFL